MEIVGDVIRKKGEPELLVIEAAKAVRANEIGRDSGLFDVPKVLKFDADAGVLDFEKIDGLVTLLDLAIRKDQRLHDLLNKTGQALAVIHRQLTLPDEMKHKLPSEWLGTPDENVFLHGDYAPINACFHEPSESLVILDWSAAPLIGRAPTFGSRYFDVLWFTTCVFCGVPYKNMFSWDAEGMANAFLKGYVEEVSSENLNKLQDYLPKICQLQKKNILYLAGRQDSLLKVVAYIVSQLIMYPRLCTFLRNLKL
jgi:tRNA A-37 threonylcarbamoyl transferase component Bud32